jgi:hypothetical protein
MGRDRFSIFVLLIVIILFPITQRDFSLSDAEFLAAFCLVLYLVAIAGYRNWTRRVQKALHTDC